MLCLVIPIYFSLTEVKVCTPFPAFLEGGGGKHPPPLFFRGRGNTAPAFSVEGEGKPHPWQGMGGKPCKTVEARAKDLQMYHQFWTSPNLYSLGSSSNVWRRPFPVSSSSIAPCLFFALIYITDWLTVPPQGASRPNMHMSQSAAIRNTFHHDIVF